MPYNLIITKEISVIGFQYNKFFQFALRRFEFFQFILKLFFFKDRQFLESLGSLVG